MENLTYNLDELYNELCLRARAEGALEKTAWKDLAESLLEQKRGMQEMDDDEAWGYALEALKGRFDEFMKGVEKM